MSYDVEKFDGYILTEEADHTHPLDSPEQVEVHGKVREIPTRKYKVDCPACSYTSDDFSKMRPHMNKEHTEEEIEEGLST